MPTLRERRRGVSYADTPATGAMDSSSSSDEEPARKRATRSTATGQKGAMLTFAKQGINNAQEQNEKPMLKPISKLRKSAASQSGSGSDSEDSDVVVNRSKRTRSSSRSGKAVSAPASLRRGRYARQQSKGAAKPNEIMEDADSVSGASEDDDEPGSEAEKTTARMTHRKAGVEAGSSAPPGRRSSRQTSTKFASLDESALGKSATKLDTAASQTVSEIDKMPDKADGGSSSSDGSSSEDDIDSSPDSDNGDSLLGEINKIHAVVEQAGKAKVLVSYKGHSHRDNEWVTEQAVRESKKQLLQNFLAKNGVTGEYTDENGHPNGINPEWLCVEKIIGQRSRSGAVEYLVKWCSLGYGESSWEVEDDIKEDKEKIDMFHKYNTPKRAIGMKLANPRRMPKQSVVPTFLNGRELRDYQEISLRWNLSNWAKRRNCILGDEMGLGKTAQSIAVIEAQRQLAGSPGPFLVVAPLTTLGHWKREIETWTPMSCVLYTGNQLDRETIQEFEMRVPASKDSKKKVVGFKFDVLLTSFETLRTDLRVIQKFTWKTAIVDEAHRLKSTTGLARQAIEALNIDWLLLLTGTPIQNNLKELFGLMNLLDSEAYPDMDEFSERFGADGTPTPEQVKDLQNALKPILLRRMKEDVEQLPEKEEVIIWVELTREQRAYYKGLYNKEIGTLLGGTSSKNLPNLRNLAMELRKVCNHPYLCNGLEADMTTRMNAQGKSELQSMVAASGKMLLLNKLLPKLKSEGHKVLIFSQFVIMLDVLEDYLNLSGFATERIDGSTAGKNRQAAIDRFCKDDSNGFVFLLSTKAGGQGITLTAADTVIIYDSDWNPQNDLQAMARCHRIGQTKDVKIYRLISRDTYEEAVFKTSSRKYGLDEAILGGMGSESDADPESDRKRIMDLLKNGAHSLTAPGQEDETAFESENIDEILTARTEKRQIGSRAGNTFSVATFAAEDTTAQNQTTEGAEEDFWGKLMPEAVADLDSKRKAAHEAALAGAQGPRRRRTKVNYQEKEGAVEESDSDDESDESAKSSRPSNSWSNAEVRAMLDHLSILGEGRTAQVRILAELTHRPLEEVVEVEKALAILIRKKTAKAELLAKKKALAAAAAVAAALAAASAPQTVPNASAAAASTAPAALTSGGTAETVQVAAGPEPAAASTAASAPQTVPNASDVAAPAAPTSAASAETALVTAGPEPVAATNGSSQAGTVQKDTEAAQAAQSSDVALKPSQNASSGSSDSKSPDTLGSGKQSSSDSDSADNEEADELPACVRYTLRNKTCSRLLERESPRIAKMLEQRAAFISEFIGPPPVKGAFATEDLPVESAPSAAAVAAVAKQPRQPKSKAPVVKGKAAGLPWWWGRLHDTAILMGSMKYGLACRGGKQSELILQDPALGFASAFRTAPAAPPAPQIPPRAVTAGDKDTKSAMPGNTVPQPSEVGSTEPPAQFAAAGSGVDLSTAGAVAEPSAKAFMGYYSIAQPDTAQQPAEAAKPSESAAPLASAGAVVSAKAVATDVQDKYLAEAYALEGRQLAAFQAVSAMMSAHWSKPSEPAELLDGVKWRKLQDKITARIRVLLKALITGEGRLPSPKKKPPQLRTKQSSPVAKPVVPSYSVPPAMRQQILERLAANQQQSQLTPQPQPQAHQGQNPQAAQLMSWLKTLPAALAPAAPAPLPAQGSTASDPIEQPSDPEVVVIDEDYSADNCTAPGPGPAGGSQAGGTPATAAKLAWAPAGAKASAPAPQATPMDADQIVDILVATTPVAKIAPKANRPSPASETAALALKVNKPTPAGQTAAHARAPVRSPATGVTPSGRLSHTPGKAKEPMVGSTGKNPARPDNAGAGPSAVPGPGPSGSSGKRPASPIIIDESSDDDDFQLRHRQSRVFGESSPPAAKRQRASPSTAVMGSYRPATHGGPGPQVTASNATSHAAAPLDASALGQIRNAVSPAAASAMGNTPVRLHAPGPSAPTMAPSVATPSLGRDKENGGLSPARHGQKWHASMPLASAPMNQARGVADTKATKATPPSSHKTPARPNLQTSGAKKGSITAFFRKVPKVIQAE